MEVVGDHQDGHLLTAGGGRSRDKWVIIQGDSGRLCLVSQDNVLYRQALYLPDKIGALDGGSGCRISILRKANVACLCCLKFPLSPVEFKKCQCLMSLYYLSQCHCRYYKGSCCPVEFKKWPCHPVDFGGLGP